MATNRNFLGNLGQAFENPLGPQASPERFQVLSGLLGPIATNRQSGSQRAFGLYAWPWGRSACHEPPAERGSL